MKIGYARVSTVDQNLEPQLHALRQDGCRRVYQEKITGKLSHRPVLDKVLASLQPGDTLVVWKLDRLGRSVQNLADVLDDLKARSVGLKSLTEGIDTGTPVGRMMFYMLAAVAEFEADMNSERTRLGVEAARRNGRRLGRPAAISPQQLKIARQLRLDEGLSCTELADRLQVGRTTLWRAMGPNSSPTLR